MENQMKVVSKGGKMLNNVTPEELKQIQEMNSTFMQLKNRVSDLELEKYSVLNQINSMRMQFQMNEKQLIEKYGEDAVINIQTGEITKKPKQDERK